MGDSRQKQIGYMKPCLLSGPLRNKLFRREPLSKYGIFSDVCSHLRLQIIIRQGFRID
jgi:hypothetical protein